MRPDGLTEHDSEAHWQSSPGILQLSNKGLFMDKHHFSHYTRGVTEVAVVKKETTFHLCHSVSLLFMGIRDPAYIGTADSKWRESYSALCISNCMRQQRQCNDHRQGTYFPFQGAGVSFIDFGLASFERTLFKICDL
jgi:hypothetical protein